jgi:hypothetical protein
MKFKATAGMRKFVEHISYDLQQTFRPKDIIVYVQSNQNKEAFSGNYFLEYVKSQFCIVILSLNCRIML